MDPAVQRDVIAVLLPLWHAQWWAPLLSRVLLLDTGFTYSGPRTRRAFHFH